MSHFGLACKTTHDFHGCDRIFFPNRHIAMQLSRNQALAQDICDIQNII
jgi:hypothetical protein